MKENTTKFMIRFEHKLINLMLSVREEKQKIVKSQNYEETARLRDKEKLFMEIYSKNFQNDLKKDSNLYNDADLSITRQAELMLAMKEDNNNNVIVITNEEKLQFKISLIKVLISFRLCMLNRNTKEDNTIKVVKDMLIADPDMNIVKELSEEFPEIEWDDVAKNKDGDFERIIRQLKIQLVLDN